MATVPDSENVGRSPVDEERIVDRILSTAQRALDENGELLCAARKIDLIVNDRDNVALIEVEQALLLHPAVAEAAVICVPDIPLGQLIVGFVVLKPFSKVAPENILRHVGKRLSAYKVPERLLIVDRIPYNGMGKAIRPRLLEQAMQMSAISGICMLSRR
jgi:acyl-coenzyme A synthetase/AMP-(fatty) acid ligase